MALLKVLAEVTLPETDLPMGTLILSVLSLAEDELFSREYSKSDNPLTPMDDPSDIFSDKSRAFHDLSASLTPALLEENPNGRRLSLFDVPLMLGLHPTRDLFADWTKLRQYFPYSFRGIWGGPEEHTLLVRNCSQVVENMLYFGGADPCKVGGILAVCCRVRDLFAIRDLPGLMTIMSHSRHRPRSHESADKLVEKFASLDYPFKELNGPRQRVDFFSMLPKCMYRSGEWQDQATKLGRKVDEYLSNCSFFHPVPTDMGLCNGFNAINPFRKSAFTEAVKEAYSESSDSDELLMSPPSGRHLGLTFVLDRRRAFRNEWMGDSLFQTRGNFEVSVSTNRIPFNFRGTKNPIRLGHRTTLAVTPSVLESSPDLMDLPFEKRECLFPTERSLRVLSSYSQSGCLFECLMEQARRTCHCTPWDYPFPPSESERHSICDFIGYYCFDQVMRNVTHIRHSCRCPPGEKQRMLKGAHRRKGGDQNFKIFRLRHPRVQVQDAHRTI